MSFGQWASDCLGVPLEERFNFNPLTYFLYSGIDGAWFDPEDMSTMYQDAAGTTPVTALEQPVGRWLDKSGNGNHATQSITASRPTLSARYNLLTKTEDFADTVWEKALCTVTNVAVSNPLNKSVVSKFVLDSTTGIHRIYQTWNPISGAKYSQGIILKYAGVRYVYINTDANMNARLCIDLNTGQFVIGGISPENPIVNFLGDGWYYVSITGTGTSTTRNNTWFQASRTLSIADDSGYVGNGVDGFYIIAAQLNQTPTALPYQRVNTATDYDSVGWPRYLRGDGVDDFYNLPFMNLYGNGACSIVAARYAVSQATDTYVISERSTTDADPKYFPSRQLANGGNMNSYIVSDEGTARLDTTGSAFSGAKLAVIRSVVDSGNNIKLFKDGVIVADDNYTRAGTLTLNNTTLGASVSTTTSNYANMRLYGLIITKSALSDTDRKRCEQFLARRLSTLGVTLS